MKCIYYSCYRLGGFPVFSWLTVTVAPRWRASHWWAVSWICECLNLHLNLSINASNERPVCNFSTCSYLCKYPPAAISACLKYFPTYLDLNYQVPTSLPTKGGTFMLHSCFFTASGPHYFKNHPFLFKTPQKLNYMRSHQNIIYFGTLCRDKKIVNP